MLFLRSFQIIRYRDGCLFVTRLCVSFLHQQEQDRRGNVCKEKIRAHKNISKLLYIRGGNFTMFHPEIWYSAKVQIAEIINSRYINCTVTSVRRSTMLFYILYVSSYNLTFLSHYILVLIAPLNIIETVCWAINRDTKVEEKKGLILTFIFLIC